MVGVETFRFAKGTRTLAVCTVLHGGYRLVQEGKLRQDIEIVIGNSALLLIGKIKKLKRSIDILLEVKI